MVKHQSNVEDSQIYSAVLCTFIRILHNKVIISLLTSNNNKKISQHNVSTFYR